MKKFTHINDIQNLRSWIEEAREIKKNPLMDYGLGKNKTLGLLFFNPSLRTRLSTQKAALNLGMAPVTLNVSKDTWGIEFANGKVMNGTSSEHIKEVAAVISQYWDIVGIRAFPTLTDKTKDENEEVLRAFEKYASISIINMESAISHPLQGFADAITIAENSKKKKPKVVLSWVPHVKVLPHCVGNSFVATMQKMNVEFVITNPIGYDLNPQITKDVPIIHNQNDALKSADFIYAKNWCSYENYGQILKTHWDWMITKDKIGNAKLMHCLPLRRNLAVDDAALDSKNSLIIEQANNRTFAIQLILKKMLESI